MDTAYDLAIIGGGINGAGVARDAAGRGLRVLLCEQDDLGGATSWASTKLIHGGLRYLEQFQFRLVYESLQERTTLQHIAPHIIRPLRFVVPHNPTLRPGWKLRAGLFLYDMMAGKHALGRSESVTLPGHPAGASLKPEWKRGFCYSDCAVKDTRLVVLNAMDASRHGAAIHTRTTCTHAERKDGAWHLTLFHHGDETTITAKALVNAAGPWAMSVGDAVLHSTGSKRLRLVKGSHIVVNKPLPKDYAFLLQQDDGRVVFAIPFEETFTLIGTTEVDYTGDPADAQISDAEVTYLCERVNTYLRTTVSPSDVVWSFAGVRPLVEDEAASSTQTSRDYTLELTDQDGSLPLLTIFGGKLTTYRKLAEQVMGKLSPYFHYTCENWTGSAPLPGGDIPDVDTYRAELHIVYPWLPEALLQRYVSHYGSLCQLFLKGKENIGALGADFDSGIYEAELQYLVDHEWALTPDDILWRRTKLGLRVSKDTHERIERWLAAR